MRKPTVKPRQVGPIIALAVIVLLVLTLVRFRHYSPYHVPGVTETMPQVVLSLNGVEAVGRSEGRKVWSFEAKRADVSWGNTRTELEQIYNGVIFDDGTPAADLEAGKAIFDSTTNDLIIVNGVKITSREGYVAETDQALWSGTSKMLRCPGEVKITTDESELVGSSLVADMRNREITIENASMTVDIGEPNDLLDHPTGSKEKEQPQ